MNLPPGTLLATDAATAARSAGTCAICRQEIEHGHRYARQLSGRLAHLGCIGAVTWRRKARG